MEFQVIKQLNPLSAMKGFGGDACSLCMEERLRILRGTRNKKERLVNSCLEIYGACRHKPRFHRLKKLPSTDECP